MKKKSAGAKFWRTLSIVIAVVAAVIIGFLIYTIVIQRTDTETEEEDVLETENETEIADISGDNYVIADDYTEYITLGQYKDLSVSYTAIPQATESDIQDVLKEYQDEYSDYISYDGLHDAEEGDYVIISYTCMVDEGLVLEYTDEYVGFTIGSGELPDSFESQLIGHCMGEVYDADITFPENYENTEFAGKEAAFTVTVNNIVQRNAPEIDDEFAEMASNGEYSNLDEWKKAIEKSLNQEIEQENMDGEISAVWEAAVENASVLWYPDDIIEKYEQSIRVLYSEYADYFDMEYDDFLLSIGADEESVYESAKEEFKSEAVAQAIAKEEGFSVTDEETEEYLQSLEDNGQIESVKGTKADYDFEYLKSKCLYNKVYDCVYSNATIIKN